MKNNYAPQEPPPIGFSSAPPQQEYAPQWANPHAGYPPQSEIGFAPQSQLGFPPQPQPGYPSQPLSRFPPQQSYPPPGYPQPGYPPQYYGNPPPPPPPVVVVNSHGWMSRNQKNKPQSNAVGGAGLIFVSGGMNIAWSIGFHGNLYFKVTQHNFLAWFIGGIIGAFVSCWLTNKVPKKLILIFSSILVMIGGIILASTRHNGSATLACSYLDGIGNGLIFAPFLALAGEVSVPYMRGLISASIEQMCLGLGILLQIIYSSAWTDSKYSSFNSENLKGVLSIIYGLLALVIGSLLCVESPVIMLADNNEQGAMEALKRLQRPHTWTSDTDQQLRDHKLYLAQNKDLSVGQSICQAIPTFIRLVFLRALNVLSISDFVVTSFVYFFVNSYGLSYYVWFCVFAVSRWMGNFIATFCMESAGRKKPTLLGLLVCGVLAFVMAAQFNILTYNTGNTIMLLVFQFFAGVAFTATSPYLSEAYPLGVKQHFIALTFMIEMLVFIIIGVCRWSPTGGAIYFYIMGGLYIFGFVLSIFILPETRRLTLREAQDKFSGFISHGF
ncbi:uncharacterized protein Dana_GF23845 [Drosophila ananassae]|uniref:Major facilitator superfamily (MFS) profile domain-containing protein n=1 Tax=Drosophila ananassae TaxID=7217 RepID=B3M593_DROAN|nr:facilitated glucose transporter protein 1 [Drosophila ananassae]EDV40598.1 uncharacterized protein Dana_GF23845 [Drosophila ananassae]